MEICKYRREDLDYGRIREDSRYAGKTYPKKLPVVDGHSTSYQISDEWFFKRKQQDGNYYLSSSVHSQHHFIYEESVGSFDDLAEVLCYTLAKNMGTRIKTDNSGNQVVVPLIDCAEYKLATYLSETEELQRGCMSRNIARPGQRVIKGIDLLNYLTDNRNAAASPANTLPNYIAALKHVSRSTGTRIDRNIAQDLIINSYFCWKVANTDNHSNNIFFVQEKDENTGAWTLSVGALIDNGSAWELSMPYHVFKPDGSMYCRYQDIYSKLTGEDEISADKVGDINLEENPFCYHNAFKLEAGDLNGHSKMLNGKKLDYEYDLAAYALTYPEIYQAIYQIEQEFDIERAFYEVSSTYSLKWPDFMKETIRATSEYKSKVLQSVMADYFCHTAYTSCVADIQGESDVLYNLFRQEMENLPLQPNLQGYISTFEHIAEQYRIPIDRDKLSTLEFLPKQPQTQEKVETDVLITQTTQEDGKPYGVC